MARESEKITRVDVRIPNEIYQKIEAIAIETNQCDLRGSQRFAPAELVRCEA